jgi:hypothetical protein
MEEVIIQIYHAHFEIDQYFGSKENKSIQALRLTLATQTRGTLFIY